MRKNKYQSGYLGSNEIIEKLNNDLCYFIEYILEIKLTPLQRQHVSLIERIADEGNSNGF